jgi:hypothetical protein
LAEQKSANGTSRLKQAIYQSKSLLNSNPRRKRVWVSSFKGTLEKKQPGEGSLSHITKKKQKRKKLEFP